MVETFRCDARWFSRKRDGYQVGCGTGREFSNLASQTQCLRAIYGRHFQDCIRPQSRESGSQHPHFFEHAEHE
jgi:hypothetical protein